MMFIPGRKVMLQGNAEFTNAAEAAHSPLAASLFALSGVTRVFYGSDFVTVTKAEDVTWPALTKDVFGALREFYQSGQELFVEGHDPRVEEAAGEDENDTVAMIKELLDTRIRPVVQEDGGDVQFSSWDPDSGTVELKMQGACSGCPSSSVTLKNGIQEMLKYYIKEVYHVVEAGGDAGEQEGVRAFQELESRLST